MEDGAYSKSLSLEENILKFIQDKMYYKAITVFDILIKTNDNLPEDFYLKYLQCLFQCERYLDVLDFISNTKIITDKDPQVKFLRGLCFYKLGMFEDAARIFGESSEWRLWEKKANFMKNKESNSALYLSEEKYTTHENIKFNWNQTENEVYLTIFASNISEKNVLIDFYPMSVDIEIRGANNDYFVKNIELYGKISTQQSNYTISHNKIDITLVKIDKSKWEKYEFEVDLDFKKEDITRDKIINLLDTVPNIDNDEILEGYNIGLGDIVSAIHSNYNYFSDLNTKKSQEK